MDTNSLTQSETLFYFTGDKAPPANPPEPIIPKILFSRAGTILSGQPGAGKTNHVIHMVACLILGKDFAGFQVSRKYRVLYIDLDGGWDWTCHMFNAAFRGLGVEGLPESFAYWSPLQLGLDVYGPPNLERFGSMLATWVKAHRADVLVVDCLGQFLEGNQNDTGDVAKSLRVGLNPSRNAGAAVLALDHSAKAAHTGLHVPTPGGSQAKRGWARVSIALEEVEHGGEPATRWSKDKTNAAPLKPFLTRLRFENRNGDQPYKLTLESIGEAAKRIAKPVKVSAQDKAREAILNHLRVKGPAQWAQLETIVGAASTLSRALKFLQKDGQVGSEGGTYSLKSAHEEKDKNELPTSNSLKDMEPWNPQRGGVPGSLVPSDFQENSGFGTPKRNAVPDGISEVPKLSSKIEPNGEVEGKFPSGNLQAVELEPKSLEDKLWESIKQLRETDPDLAGEYSQTLNRANGGNRDTVLTQMAGQLGVHP